MNTDIEKELAKTGDVSPFKEVNYAYKYGSLRGILIMLDAYAAVADESPLKQKVLAAVRQAEEVDRE
jgi:hypothetical protein